MTSHADEGSFDAGWLFVVAGLVICAAGLLIPAQRDLADLKRQLEELRLQESVANDRLNAHTDFLHDLDAEDPALVRRLAGAHLNLMPGGDTPALLASSMNAPVTDWIDATVRVPVINDPPEELSRLARWATGPRRLWMLALGVMCVFVGLVLDPGIGRAPRTVREGAGDAPTTPPVHCAPDAALAVASLAPVAVATLDSSVQGVVLVTAGVDEPLVAPEPVRSEFDEPGTDMMDDSPFASPPVSQSFDDPSVEIRPECSFDADEPLDLLADADSAGADFHTGWDDETASPVPLADDVLIEPAIFVSSDRDHCLPRELEAAGEEASAAEFTDEQPLRESHRDA